MNFQSKRFREHVANCIPTQWQSMLRFGRDGAPLAASIRSAIRAIRDDRRQRRYDAWNTLKRAFPNAFTHSDSIAFPHSLDTTGHTECSHWPEASSRVSGWPRSTGCHRIRFVQEIRRFYGVTFPRP